MSALVLVSARYPHIAADSHFLILLLSVYLEVRALGRLPRTLFVLLGARIFVGTRHTLLTDRQALHFFELPKLPEVIAADDELKLWLTLFNAETEEELKKIEEMGVSVMKEAIGAYRHVSATDEFREIERLRSRARHNEASAIGHAVDMEREKWQGVVAGKDAVLAAKDAQIAELKARLGETL